MFLKLMHLFPRSALEVVVSGKTADANYQKIKIKDIGLTNKEK